MTLPIIDIRSLSKRYMIAHERRAPDTLRDAVVQRLTRRGTGQREALWALKGIDLEVERGDVVGIIGPNGSGKSTLLKILSRIVVPTEGRAVLRGRPSSLLEVGTGFHPELNGRENIYLNGALLGMRRREIATKFDEIVAFSGVERFLDTPVKFYSSGMFVRLAFAVAAHLDPDILIVDEVLAVGDLEFQRKRLGKMKAVTEELGRTVLFVSHNLAAVQSICTKTAVLRRGELEYFGDTTTATALYRGDDRGLRSRVALEQGSQPKLRFDAIELRGADGQPRNEFTAGEQAVGVIDYTVVREGSAYQVVVEVWNDDDICVLATSNFDGNRADAQRIATVGSYRATCTLETGLLREGHYELSLSSSIPGIEMLDEAPRVIGFHVKPATDETSYRALARRGVIYQELQWTVTRR